MRSSGRLLGLLAILSCCCEMLLPARAADWRQWGGSDGRNMVSDEKGLPETFVPGKKQPGSGAIDLGTTTNVKWAVWLGSFGYGNPTVSGGRVFTGTDDLTLENDPRLKRRRGGMVQCFDEATGELRWRLAIPPRTKLPARTFFEHQYLGVCSSPTFDGDCVYVVSSANEVLCLDADGLADGNDGPYQDEGKYMVEPGENPVELMETDGDIVWRFDMIDELGVSPHDAASCSAVVHGDLVYVGTSNGVDESHDNVVAPQAPSLIVLDKRTGRLAATDGEKIGTRMWHCQWASPSLGEVAGRTLVFFGGADGVCYAFEALEAVPEKPVTLTKVWSFDCCPAEFRFRDGKPIPYYDGDTRKHRGNKNDGQYVGPSEIMGTPVFVNDRIYVAIGQDPMHGRAKGMLHCIDATKTGDITQTGKVWSYDGIDRSLSNVTVHDGLVYAPDVAGRLHCLDADTGQCRWVHEMKAETWGSPLVADGKVYIGNKEKLLVLAAGREAKVLSEIYLGSSVYATPVVADGVLYVTSQRHLWAVQEGSLGAQ